MAEVKKLSHYVGGEWVVGAAAQSSHNPAEPSDIVAEVPAADSDLLHVAADVGAEAGEEWASATPEVRADCLHRVSEHLDARREEIADLLSREQGKVIAEAHGEVVRASRIFRYFAGEAVRRHGLALDSVRPGVDVHTRREAVGLFALVTPWNFPLSIPAWKTAPALAFGNSVVLKPAGPTPAIADALARAIDAAGVPAGVFNLVYASGSSTNALLEHPAVRGISFTGSTSVGQSIGDGAIRRQQRIQLEMGGKNALVILDDADLDTAVRCALDGAFFGTGQRCTASSRLIVTDAIHDRFVAAFSAAVSALRVGDPRNPDVQVGPVATSGQFENILGYIEIARSEGAVIAAGGGPVKGEGQGYFIRPTLLTGCSPDMRSSCEEIFGPVASVLRVADYEGALALANATPFGLSAGIVTRSLASARDFQRRARAGMVMVNLPTAGVDYHVPFGGTKQSSYGPREQGFAAVEFYTTQKTIYVA